MQRPRLTALKVAISVQFGRRSALALGAPCCGRARDSTDLDHATGASRKGPVSVGPLDLSGSQDQTLIRRRRVAGMRPSQP